MAYHSAYCKPEAKNHNKERNRSQQRNLNNKLKVSNAEIHSIRECVNLVTHTNFTALCFIEVDF